MTGAMQQNASLVDVAADVKDARKNSAPSVVGLPNSIPAMLLQVIGALALVGAVMEWMYKGLDIYVASLFSSFVAMTAAGSGLQYLFDIRNHILRERRNDA